MKASVTIFRSSLVIAGALLLQGCQGILSDIYDEPERVTRSEDQLYIDASDWTEWHYMDIRNLPTKSLNSGEGSVADTWITYPIPISSTQNSDPLYGQSGIYTYHYDVFGIGISSYEYLGFSATGTQKEPADWTIAVHRNNVRTNDCGVYETDLYSFDDIPQDRGWLETLDYVEDEWNQTDVWVVQDRMLSGIIGNQGIRINKVLSRWLDMEIPPMPPVFRMNRHIFILRLPDKTYAGLQLADYMSSAGEKCCLTVNFKYPL